jgi:glutathione synthase/RimK-type ligase-like ATP-grasp enzyme
MSWLIVVERPDVEAMDVPGAEVVSALDYLSQPRFTELRRAKVFNLCRDYAYQSTGYYVSLLAEARGHKPLPSVTTLQDLKQSSLIRIVSEDIEHKVQQCLSPLKTDRFEVSIYFGRNLARRYDGLCQALFDHFPAPLLRASFVRSDEWRLQWLRPIAYRDVPESHRSFVVEQAQRFFKRPKRASPRARFRYDLAILINPDEIDAPSCDRALKRFVRAANETGMDATLIGRQDYGRIGEFDALFIRETTSVHHLTFRFARRAEAEGLVVLDDPRSILRCSNKVYQAELFEKAGVSCPRTLVVHRETAHRVGPELGFPCVLKRPDSCFSAGVVKADNPDELSAHLHAFFQKSELVVAQEFVKSGFDWRVGVLAGRPLFVCRYHMARGHWQVQKAQSDSRRSYGKVETVAEHEWPAGAVELGVRAANLIGNGLYGVDLKEIDGKFLVMEVNDNPNIDADNEDKILGSKLYEAIMTSIVERLDSRR